MSVEREQDELMESLWFLHQQKQELEKQLEAVKRADATTRNELLKMMAARHIRRMDDPEGGFTITATRRKNTVVEDMESLMEDIEEMGLASEVMKLDLPAVKRLSKEVPLRGLRDVEATHLTLTPTHDSHDPAKIVKLNNGQLELPSEPVITTTIDHGSDQFIVRRRP